MPSGHSSVQHNVKRRSGPTEKPQSAWLVLTFLRPLASVCKGESKTPPPPSITTPKEGNGGGAAPLSMSCHLQRRAAEQDKKKKGKMVCEALRDRALYFFNPKKKKPPIVDQ